MNLRELKGTRSGDCAIIANGASLTRQSLKEIKPRFPGIDTAQDFPQDFPLAEKHPELLTLPLGTIPVPTFTMNRSWMLAWPTVGHMVLEEAHQRFYPAVYGRLAVEGKLFTAGGRWPNEAFKHAGYNTKINSSKAWSVDPPGDGVVVSLGTCGTVTLATMQVAAYLGFTTLWMIGLDLGGGRKFTGHAVGKLEEQRNLFKLAAPEIAKAGITVRVVGRESHCDAFPRVDWPWPLDRSTGAA